MMSQLKLLSSKFVRTVSGRASLVNYLDQDFEAGEFMSGEYEFGPGLNREELRYVLDAFMLDSSYTYSTNADMDDYEVQETVTAWYVMTEFKIGQYVTFLPGVRYEYTKANMTGRKGSVSSGNFEPDPYDPPFRDTLAVNSYEDWLPMIHLRIKPVEWFDIRLAYTNALSRPRLDWQLPKQKVLGSSQSVELGRPDLRPQTAQNYDIFLSFNGGWLGLFTIGGFYKDIDDLIFSRKGHKILNAEAEGFQPNFEGLWLDRPENNPFQTEVKGFEIEWQTNFRWLPKPFDGIVLYANYTYIDSETKFPRSFVKLDRIPEFPFVLTTVIDTFRIGPMPDQIDNIANVAVGYALGGFHSRISALFQGKSLTSVGERPELDGYVASLLRWDLSLRYDMTESFMIYLNWNNISNEADETFQHQDRFTTNKEFYGWTGSIGVRFRR